jgi:hypothetical protein
MIKPMIFPSLNRPGMRRGPAIIERPVAAGHRFSDMETMPLGIERFPAGPPGLGREKGDRFLLWNVSGSQDAPKQPRLTLM